MSALIPDAPLPGPCASRQGDQTCTVFLGTTPTGPSFSSHFFVAVVASPAQHLGCGRPEKSRAVNSHWSAHREPLVGRHAVDRRVDRQVVGEPKGCPCGKGSVESNGHAFEVVPERIPVLRKMRMYEQHKREGPRDQRFGSRAPMTKECVTGERCAPTPPTRSRSGRPPSPSNPPDPTRKPTKLPSSSGAVSSGSVRSRPTSEAYPRAAARMVAAPCPIADAAAPIREAACAAMLPCDTASTQRPPSRHAPVARDHASCPRPLARRQRPEGKRPAVSNAQCRSSERSTCESAVQSSACKRCHRAPGTNGSIVSVVMLLPSYASPPLARCATGLFADSSAPCVAVGARSWLRDAARGSPSHGIGAFTRGRQRARSRSIASSEFSLGLRVVKRP